MSLQYNKPSSSSKVLWTLRNELLNPCFFSDLRSGVGVDAAVGETAHGVWSQLWSSLNFAVTPFGNEL